MSLEHLRGLGIAGVDSRRADADAARGEEIEQPLEVGPRADDHLAATLLGAREDRRYARMTSEFPPCEGKSTMRSNPCRARLSQ